MLRVSGARVVFGTTCAVDGVDLEVGERETVAVIGPSGCGKSTLLRAVAGLQPLDAGTVSWDGGDLSGVPPHRRGFGMVFQEYALFPHRDVAGNVAFGLRMQGVGPAERDRRVDDALELVGLGGFRERRVATLSGGEQQRVALARALVARPRLLMLDEPLGALDRVWRARLVDELPLLLAGAGTPALYVTHDHEEAFAVADRVAVMRDGRIVQSGPPAALWDRPADAWTAGFLGFGPAVDAEVRGPVLHTPWGPLAAPAGAPAGAVRLVVRPDGVAVGPGGAVEGTVTRVRFAGARAELTVVPAAGPALRAAVVAAAAPPAGAVVGCGLGPDALLCYPRPAD